jgi:3-dehydroquinate dehydratase-1
VVKVAATAKTSVDLARLFEFYNWSQKVCPGQIALMGMGALGQVSRLLFGAGGSVLNYGFLGEAQVSGQWQAEVLRERLKELGAVRG